MRCVVLMLGNDSYACFDTDLLRLSVAWRGGFMSLTTMAQVSYNQPFNKNNQIPRVLGKPMLATGLYPGWLSGEPPAFRDPRPAGPEPLPELSDREREVLRLMGGGANNREIADRLVISGKTVSNHITNIFSKLQLADRAEAVRRAREAGLGA